MAPVSFVEIFLPFPGNPFSPLGDLWRIPLGPPPTPSWPFAVLRGPSWISFCLFLEILPPTRPLAGPSRASANPFVALRRSSWSFVDILLPFPGNPFSPWRPLADPSRASSNPFVALRRSSWSFVDIFLPFPGNPFSPLGDPWRIPLEPPPTPSWPFVDKSFLSVRGSSWIPSWITLFPCWSVRGEASP